MAEICKRLPSAFALRCPATLPLHYRAMHWRRGEKWRDAARYPARRSISNAARSHRAARQLHHLSVRRSLVRLSSLYSRWAHITAAFTARRPRGGPVLLRGSLLVWRGLPCLNAASHWAVTAWDMVAEGRALVRRDTFAPVRLGWTPTICLGLSPLSSTLRDSSAPFCLHISGYSSYQSGYIDVLST